VVATEIFRKIEEGEYEVEILESVIMEAFFVLTKFYKLPKSEVLDDLKKIIALKVSFIPQLTLYDHKNASQILKVR
jgi:hypothetical protein